MPEQLGDEENQDENGNTNIEVPEQLGDEENQDVNGNTNIEVPEQLGDEENQDVNGNTNIEVPEQLGDEENQDENGNTNIEVPEQLGDEENQDVNGNTNIEVPEQLGDEENQDVNGEKTLEDSIDGGMNQRARKTGDRTLNDTVDGWSVGSKLKPKLKTMIRCKFIDDEEEKTLRVVSRGGKATSINRQWYNVYNSEDGEGKMFSINWERIEEWKSLPEETLISTNNQDYETLEANIESCRTGLIIKCMMRSRTRVKIISQFNGLSHKNMRMRNVW